MEEFQPSTLFNNQGGDCVSAEHLVLKMLQQALADPLTGMLCCDSCCEELEGEGAQHLQNTRLLSTQVSVTASCDISTSALM